MNREPRTLLLGEETVTRPAPENLAPGDEALFAHEFTRRIGNSTARLLHEVTVLPNGFLLDGARLLPESFGGRPGGLYALRLRASLLKNALKARTLVPVGKALFLTDEFSNGFFHWICDALPRLEAVDPRELTTRTIVIPAMADFPYVRESLAAYGEVTLRCLSRGEKARCAELLVLSPAAPTGNYRPRLMTALRERFRNHFGTASGTRKLYVSRWTAARRRVANEHEVRRMLELNGFQTIATESLSFAEQVRLLGSARVLVGNHGAGLTNMAWMAPLTTVLELRSTGDRENNCYYSLAAALGIRYRYLQCPPVRGGQSTHLADVTVDLSELEKQVRAIG